LNTLSPRPRDEFYRVAFRKKIYGSIAELQGDLDRWVQSYKEKGRTMGWCFGKTPLQTFLDAKPPAKEKLITACVSRTDQQAGKHTHTRKMLVEAAWSAKTAPGPLRAFFERVQRNRGAPAAAVATARKLALMIWHVLTDWSEYAYAACLNVAPPAPHGVKPAEALIALG
jgi:hypothetical protein